MLTVITGPMFSGKTERLISLCTAHYFAGNKILAFKPANDNRYNESFITSHNQIKWLATSIEPHKPNKILELFKGAYFHEDEQMVDVVAIDEAQFFEPEELIRCVELILYVYGQSIIISGLSQDSDGKPFGAMPHLLAIADDIVHLKSVCAKNKTIGTATRTHRKDKSNKNQVAVGGAEMYEPRSFEAWLGPKQRRFK